MSTVALDGSSAPNEWPVRAMRKPRSAKGINEKSSESGKVIKEVEPTRQRRVRVTKQGTWCPVEVTQQRDPHEAEMPTNKDAGNMWLEPTSLRHMRVTKQDSLCLVEVTQQGDQAEAEEPANLRHMRVTKQDPLCSGGSDSTR